MHRSHLQIRQTRRAPQVHVGHSTLHARAGSARQELALAYSEISRQDHTESGHHLFQGEASQVEVFILIFDF